MDGGMGGWVEGRRDGRLRPHKPPWRPVSGHRVTILNICFLESPMVLEWLGWEEQVKKPGCSLVPEAPRRLFSLCGINGGVSKVGGVLAEVGLQL